MKRDMNLIREILLAIEADPNGEAPDPLLIEGYSDTEIGYHTLLLLEAGYVEGLENRTNDTGSPSAIANRMTWAGHEFLDAARDQGRWSEALRRVQANGGTVAIGVLTQLLSSLAKNSLGLA